MSKNSEYFSLSALKASSISIELTVFGRTPVGKTFYFSLDTRGLETPTTSNTAFYLELAKKNYAANLRIFKYLQSDRKN